MVIKTVSDKLVIKNNVIYTKIPSTSRLVTKTQYYLDEQGLEKKIEDIDKKIPIATTQKLQRLKTRYLVLLDLLLLLLSTQKPQKLMADITNRVTKAILNPKATLTEKKTPDTTGFINNLEFNILTKLSFDARVEEAPKGLPSKIQVDNALDVADKNRKK